MPRSLRLEILSGLMPSSSNISLVCWPSSGVAVWMRDGVRLSADVFLPDRDGPFPTIVTRTPYESGRDVFLDVGAGIDMISGCVNIHRPFAGSWVNYRIKDYDYSNIDYLKYTGEGEHKIL